ncbi:translation initiation factor IF-2-like isoform X2 [Gallus gallus]|uniref:translation initiation factor IF-2-like isoform X2 n=1 Tax=Gallus gallus TaxID=9031 RepID=UPI001F01F1C5|nr:translation initiation factor IF-2-like isoform X2 [Gallus gallus]
MGTEYNNTNYWNFKLRPKGAPHAVWPEQEDEALPSAADEARRGPAAAALPRGRQSEPGGPGRPELPEQRPRLITAAAPRQAAQRRPRPRSGAARSASGPWPDPIARLLPRRLPRLPSAGSPLQRRLGPGPRPRPPPREEASRKHRGPTAPGTGPSGRCPPAASAISGALPYREQGEGEAPPQPHRFAPDPTGLYLPPLGSLASAGRWDRGAARRRQEWGRLRGARRGDTVPLSVRPGKNSTAPRRPSPPGPQRRPARPGRAGTACEVRPREGGRRSGAEGRPGGG